MPLSILTPPRSAAAGATERSCRRWWASGDGQDPARGHWQRNHEYLQSATCRTPRRSSPAWSMSSTATGSSESSDRTGGGADMVANETPDRRSTSPSLWHLFEERVAANPDAPVVVTPDEGMTFAELHDRAVAAAAGLRNLGVSEGTVVSWQLPTRPDTVVLTLALASARRDPEPAPADAPPRRGRVHRRASVGPTASSSCQEFNGFDFGCDGAASSRMPRVRGSGSPCSDDETPDRRPVHRCRHRRPTGDEVRWYYYTSGTTSAPKGARHTDANVDRRRSVPVRPSRCRAPTTVWPAYSRSPTSPAPSTSRRSR